MKKLPLALSFITLSILCGASRALAQDQGAQMVDPNRVVMVVNGEEIKGGEYYRRMEYLQGVGTTTGNAFSEFPPGFMTIQRLINERLVFALAKEKGVYPSDQEVDAEIKIRQDDNPTVLEQWMSSGGTIDELKYQLRVQLAEFKLQTFGITITDTEVEMFYKEHPDLYTVPKLYQLRIIAVASAEDSKAVDADLAAGKSFADEAKAKSIDVTKSLGGEYGKIPDYKLSTVSKEAITATKIGETTKWLTTSNGGGTGTYLKFLVEDIIPPKKLDLDSRLRRQIRRKLMADKGSVKNTTMPKELDAERAKAKIEIKQPEFADAYKKFLDSYLKQRGLG